VDNGDRGRGFDFSLNRIITIEHRINNFWIGPGGNGPLIAEKRHLRYALAIEDRQLLFRSSDDPILKEFRC
jgi:hypothetical protein